MKALQFSLLSLNFCLKSEKSVFTSTFPNISLNLKKKPLSLGYVLFPFLHGWFEGTGTVCMHTHVCVCWGLQKHPPAVRPSPGLTSAFGFSICKTRGLDLVLSLIPSLSQSLHQHTAKVTCSGCRTAPRPQNNSLTLAFMAYIAPLAPGNHWSAFYHYSLISSGKAYNKTHIACNFLRFTSFA